MHISSMTVTSEKFLTMRFTEAPEAERGFSVPRAGDAIIEWTASDGDVLARLVVADDGRSVEMEYLGS